MSHDDKKKLMNSLKALGYTDKQAVKRMVTVYSRTPDTKRKAQYDRWGKADDGKKKEYMEKYKKEQETSEAKKAGESCFPRRVIWI